MPVRFLIGRAGSGKTLRCLDEIAGACVADPFGAPAIYLVPEQATYLSERALLTHGTLDGFCRAHVLSFTRLAYYLFSHGPAPGRPRLTATHRSLIATMLVMRKRRESGTRLYHAIGLEEALDALVSETRQYAVDADALRQAANRLNIDKVLAAEPVAELLEGKLQTLAEMLEGFRQIVGDRFEDPQDTLLSLHDIILNSDILQGASIHIDGFLSFTPVEEHLMVALARKATRLTVSLPGDPARAKRLLAGEKLSRHPIFTHPEETLLHLQRVFSSNGIAFESPLLLAPEKTRFVSPALVDLEAGFLRRGRTPSTASEGIEIRELDNPLEEARYAAETVSRWMSDYGWAFEDIGILARDLDTYAAPLEEALRNLRIPHFIDRSLPLETHPLINGMRSLIRAAIFSDRAEHLIELGKTGLLPVERPLVDALEAHTMQYPRSREEWFSASPWTARPSRSPFEDEEQIEEKSVLPERIDEARLTIASAVKDFRNDYTKESRKEGPLADFLSALAGTVANALRGRTLDPDDEKILARVEETLGEVNDIAGSEVFEWEAAGDLTMRALAGLSLPRIPPLLDQVHVGQADRSRQPPLKGVIVLGFNEAQFPKVAGNVSLLNDGERVLLEKAGVELRPDSRRMFQRESMLAYRALTSASDRVAIMRARGQNDGAAMVPSPYWEEICRLFPAIEVETPPSRDDPSRTWRPREYAAAAMRSFDETHLQSTESPLLADGVVAPIQSTPYWVEVAAVRESAMWKNEARLDVALLEELLKRKLALSVTQLESFAKCPFQHYVRYLLRPMELLRPEFESRDIGNYCHAVMRNFTALVRDRNLYGVEMDDEQVDALFTEAVSPPRERIERGGLLAASTSKILVERVTAYLRDLAGWLVVQAGTVPHRPAMEEQRVGREGEGVLEGLSATGFVPGWEMELRGQIDRIDVLTEGDGGSALCIDYKLRSKKFDTDSWRAGENIQLPLYLLTVSRATPYQPDAGLYLEILPGDLSIGEPKSRKYCGLARASFYDKLEGQEGPWGRRYPVQGAQNDPNEKPAAWGTAVTDEQFDRILEETEKMVTETAVRIVSGDIAVTPSRRGNITACAYCEYGGLCGIDYRLNRANVKPLMGRVGVLTGLDAE